MVALILRDLRASRVRMLPWGAGGAAGLALPSCGLEAASMRGQQVAGWGGGGGVRVATTAFSARTAVIERDANTVKDNMRNHRFMLETTSRWWGRGMGGAPPRYTR